MDEPKCRCGWDGTGEHFCHRCGKKPGKRRFLTHLTSLSGMQMKLGAHETHGCDECVEEYVKLQREASKNLG